MVDDSEQSELNLTCLIAGIYNRLNPGERNSLQLGLKFALAREVRDNELLTKLDELITSQISKLLVELFYPFLPDTHHHYMEIREKCLSDFLKGTIH